MKHRVSRSILLLLMAIVGGNLWAQAPNGYYNSASGLTGTELRQALHNTIKGHHVVSYSGLLNAFADTDCKPNGKIWDIYSNFEFDPNSGVCGDYEKEGDCWNREHTWPQSWFDPNSNNNDTARSDLFHVYPTDGFVNGQRANYPYGEVSNPIYTSGNGSKLGPCVTSGYSGRVFEPVDEYKGDIARSYFYMSVRYYHGDDTWGTSDMTNKSEILPWAMTMLLRWSDEDPVSQKEIDRNNAVYSKQHNRNPFIDHPEYAHMIWDPNWQGGGNVGNGDYVKVTSVDELTDGDYLIVCENNNVAFNGALTTLDATGNTISVTIADGVIASSSEMDAAVFTITAKTGGYSIKSASGYYIGQTIDANGLLSSTSTSYTNVLSFSSEGNANIVSSGGAYLRFNANSGQERFRYFKSNTYTNQKAVQLYKKVEMYSITFTSVAHGSISANVEEAFEGDTIILVATPDPCYALTQWEVTDAQGNAVAVVDGQFEMPASDVTVSAVFTYSPQNFVQEYQLVTSFDQLIPGRTYLIVNVANGKALGTTQNSNNRSASAVTIEDGIISSIGNTVCELTLGATGSNWTFFDASWGSNGGYLYAASSSNNYLRTQASNTANGQWSITIDDEGIATLQAQGSNTRNLLKYNNSSNVNVFACYASGSTQLDVCLFRRTEIYDYPAELTVELDEGWNWWSTNLAITLDDLKSALGTHGIKITAQNGKFITYNPNNGSWSGNLQNVGIELGKMYKIKTNEACSITLNGTPANSADYPISLSYGNNWIGFISGESMTLDQAFINFTPTDRDVIKSVSAKATYYEGYGWQGRLTTLEPGQGYIYKSKANNTVIFYFPPW